MESEAIQFAGILTKNEYKKYNLYARRKYRFKATVLFFIFSFLIYAMLFRKIISSLFLAAFLALVLWLLLRVVIPFKARSEWVSNRLIKQAIQYTATKEGIVQVRDASQILYRWTDFISAYEHKEMFRLHISNNQGVLIPKRFFSNEEDRNAFRKLLGESMPDKSVHLN
ncbi:MAG: YcxB family protein [Sporolactobacillus sp.]